MFCMLLQVVYLNGKKMFWLSKCLKNHWTKHKLVRTHVNTLSILISTITREFNMSDFIFQIHGKFMPSALGFCAQNPRNWAQRAAYKIAPVILRRWVKLYQMFMFYSCQAFPWHPSHDIWYRLYIIKFQEAVTVMVRDLFVY